MVLMFVSRIFALLVSFAVGSNPVAQQGTKSASITVRVADERGNAVRNARVHFVHGSSRHEQEQVTDETGSATADVQPGSLDLIVTSTGFLSLLLRGVEINPGEHKKYDLVLKEPTDCCIDLNDPDVGIEPERAKLGNLEEPMEPTNTLLPPNPNHSGSKGLPEGVLKALASDAKEYCEDQFAEGFRKGCSKKFEAHLRWRELSITPSGEFAVLVENNNTGYCGSGGCALYLFVQGKNGRFIQVLGSQGGLGALERVTVLTTITNGHFDIRVTWSVPKGHSVYKWDGSRYSE